MSADAKLNYCTAAISLTGSSFLVSELISMVWPVRVAGRSLRKHSGRDLDISMLRNPTILWLLMLAPLSMAAAQPGPQGATAKAAPPVKNAQPSVAPSASDLGYLTGDQLSRRCGQSDPSSSSYCFAYIAAVTDTARAYEIWLNAKEFCLPSRLSQAETRRAFLTYLAVYPNQGAGQAASVVVNALKQTYPCE